MSDKPVYDPSAAAAANAEGLTVRTGKKILSHGKQDANVAPAAPVSGDTQGTAGPAAPGTVPFERV